MLLIHWQKVTPKIKKNANTTANKNTAIGQASLSGNSTGASNTAVGHNSTCSGANGSSAFGNDANATAQYDLGQAVAFMLTEAVNQGLVSHEMSGFDAEEAARLLQIPDDFQAISVTAIGYYGDASLLPEDMLQSEMEDRKRKNDQSMLFWLPADCLPL